MKKFVLLAVAVLVVSIVVSSVALAAPKSVLGKIVGFYFKKEKAKVIEVKRDMDNTVYVIILKNGKIKAYKHAGTSPRQEVKSLRKYDLDKISKMKGSAGQAHKVVMSHPPLTRVKPFIRAVELKEKPDGKLFYYVHVYTGVGHHRGSWEVNAANWKVSKKKLTKDECKDVLKEIWTEDFPEKEEEEAE